MSQIPGVSDALFLPWGRTLLVGSFAFSLVRAMREEDELSGAFESLAIGFLALTFYPQGGAILSTLSQEIQSYLNQAGAGTSSEISPDLKQHLLDLIKKAAETPVNGKPVTGGVNIPAVTEQVWKFGVWGVLSMIVQWVFLLSHLLLESAQAVLWKLLVILFPLACGVYPLAPRILMNLALYAVELSLWMPILLLINLATSDVARTSVNAGGSFGLQLIAVEVMTIMMILSVPSVTHRFMSGAFNSDMGAGDHVVGKGKSWIQNVKVWRAEAARKTGLTEKAKRFGKVGG